jgi:chromosome segregation ATPase
MKITNEMWTGVVTVSGAVVAAWAALRAARITAQGKLIDDLQEEAARHEKKVTDLEGKHDKKVAELEDKIEKIQQHLDSERDQRRRIEDAFQQEKRDSAVLISDVQRVLRAEYEEQVIRLHEEMLSIVNELERVKEEKDLLQQQYEEKIAGLQLQYEELSKEHMTLRGEHDELKQRFNVNGKGERRT